MTEAGYTQHIPYLVEFDGSVRGLRAGAPVEFRGIRVGTVTDVRLEIDPEQDTLRIPVALEIEPQRFGAERGPGEQRYAVMGALVERGLRAQLKSGNLLIGSWWSISISTPTARRRSSTAAAPIQRSLRCPPSWRRWRPR